MRANMVIAISTSLAMLSAAVAADTPVPNTPIVRKPLLTAVIDHEKNVQRVEVKEIEFKPNQKTGLHLHPCPVIGYIVEGTITFQVEGQETQILKAGDAFYEPANTDILRFDAGDKKAIFVVSYLLGKDDHEIIKMR